MWRVAIVADDAISRYGTVDRGRGVHPLLHDIQLIDDCPVLQRTADSCQYNEGDNETR